ncbi:ATP-binding protein [Gaetbulibacter aquiaggeris]|uniref:histidine kinase n=1 Tax=Gaetbulibacter aquiaggeris TaxID=1735373 RepID=A0ABW7MMI0_9FLAO
MPITKEQLLKKCHKDFLELCFGNLSLEQVKNLVSEKITGYGTNINEKIQSLDDFISLLNLQREESAGLIMDFQFSPVSKTLFAQNNAAVCIDEVILTMTIEENKLELSVRISSVFEFLNEHWRVVHFHGSLAQGVEGDQDTWTVNEWKQKNAVLEKIINERTEELKQSLENLKATQSQLIQSEKMASLGELTAGIAHEIQNPLNFVNNFSEVTNELVDEMNEELNKGDLEEAKAISSDIKHNLEKINHHGKRADSIVKGMLQHSRSSNGTQEPTDINALADEYVRLAYHGLRAKDKSFNASIITDFDDCVNKLNVVPQDIGRVMLNLITNAFYAVHERSKQDKADYQATVTVRTQKASNRVDIQVTDNGYGIPDAIKEKIFQPFFTTKPTGQGTGLGLSLSYDIVKAHGGDIKVESTEKQGTRFVISLPINTNA